MEIAHNLSATSSNEFDESQEQTKQKSKEEIMEIIFGRGVVPSTNSKDGETVQNGGFQVSYCSDYDDDQDNMEVSTVDSPKNNEVTNCVNNNVHKRQKLDDSSKINMSKSNGRKSNKRSNTNNVVDSKSSSSNKSDANTEDTNEDLSNKTLSKSRISRSSAYQTQCYTNEDLYKPRPSFGSSRRRKVSAL
ncbi:myb-like protein D isoform X2 [Ctenocephalides felis]|uniref:myb-like protein D isoform X2 n=1 Tax=Ctenocephalides felis TaxID=7515 RepID=UPI000E6E35FB|nr:myb-like protein D isoform X2 [Ctenocephalides felis]